MVLARDLSTVARWLGSISTHEDKIKIKKYPTNVSFFFSFFFFSIFEFRILKFEI